MPNIILSPNRWKDGNNTSPPSVWNGTLYDFTGYDGGTTSIFATANAGDTIAFTLNNLSSSNVPIIPNGFQVLVNGVQVYSYDLTKVGSATFSSSPLNHGDQIHIWANTQYISTYAVDFTLSSPPPPPPVILPYVRLTWSDDGGHNWSNAQEQSMGAIGQTSQRVIFRRIGSTRRNTGLDRIFEISSDAYTQVCLVGASIGDG